MPKSTEATGSCSLGYRLARDGSSGTVEKQRQVDVRDQERDQQVTRRQVDHRHRQEPWYPEGVLRSKDRSSRRFLAMLLLSPDTTVGLRSAARYATAKWQSTS